MPLVAPAARAADPDETRGRVREFWSRADRKAQGGPLLEIAGQADPRAWSPATSILLAGTLYSAGERDAAVALLRRARPPARDVWLNYHLAGWLRAMPPTGPDEAIGYYRAARCPPTRDGARAAPPLESGGLGEEATTVFADLVRLRPDDGPNWSCYGRLLKQRGEVAAAGEATAKAVATLPRGSDSSRRRRAPFKPGQCPARAGKEAEGLAFREAIRLAPDFGDAYNNPAIALSQQGKPDEAIAAFHDAIRREPADSKLHVNLAAALLRKAKVDEAIAEYHEAIRLRPDLADAHYNLAVVLGGQQKTAEAIAEYYEAIRLRPDLAEAHYNLASALLAQGKWTRPSPNTARSSASGPTMPRPTATFGQFISKGDFVRTDAYRKGHELGSKRPDWPYPSAEWVRQAERAVALEARLPAVIRGDDRPRMAPRGRCSPTWLTRPGGMADRPLYAERSGPTPISPRTCERRPGTTPRVPRRWPAAAGASNR